MKKRIFTGTMILLVVAIFLISRMFTPYAFDIFAGLLAIMGCVEVARVLERKRMFTNIIFVGSFPAILYVAMQLGIIMQRDWVYLLLYLLIVLVALFIINYLFTFLCTGITRKEKDKYGVFDKDSVYALKKSMNSTFVMIYPAMLFACLFIINHFFDFSFTTTIELDTNIIIVFYLVLLFAVTMMTDTFALVVGMLVKGPKLCPLISPNKTISGAIGGLVFGSASGLLVYYLFSNNIIFSKASILFGLDWWKILIVSIVASIIGQIGDLIASALKRSARVKDYGTIFPGHGGVMDRVDGLIFNALTIVISMFIML